jgi:hypothetical protein
VRVTGTGERLQVTKAKAERWTHRRAFAQARGSPNIQLLPYSLVTFSRLLRKPGFADPRVPQLIRVLGYGWG